MTLRLEVETASGEIAQRTFDVKRMYNYGSATRDADDAVPHQEEVAAAGVKIAFDIPAPRTYPISPHNVLIGGEIGVHNDETSGEVEIVLLVDGGELFVGVGSDHTDRALERTSIVWSKQAYPNVLAPRVWPFADVCDHWDDLVLRSWVDGRQYQDVSTSIFLHPDDMLKELAERVRELPPTYLLFCGTFVSVDKALGFGGTWRFELHDPSLGRRIQHEYVVANLLGEMVPAHRVPLVRT